MRTKANAAPSSDAQDANKPASLSTSVLRRRGEVGFTIVEVAMAAFVLTFGIGTAVITLNRGFQALDTARNTTLGAQILQGEIENLRLHNWSQLPDVGTNTFDPAIGTDSSLANRFNCTRLVEHVDGSNDGTGVDKTGTMKVITLTVTWTGMTGVPHVLRTQTYYTKNGLYDYFYTTH